MFSITTGWPSRLCNSAAAARMMTSVTLPAAIDTIMRIGFVRILLSWRRPARQQSSQKCAASSEQSTSSHFLPVDFQNCYSITSSARETLIGDLHSDRFGGLEIDDQLESLWRLHWNVGRLGAAKIFSTKKAPCWNSSGKIAPYDIRPPASALSRVWNIPASRGGT